MKKPMPAQAELFPATALRDEALARVVRNSGDWHTRAFSQAMLAISRHAGERMTGEQLRLLVYPEVGEPHHHNVWGAIINALIAARLLTPTTQFAHMAGPKSNARLTRVYLLTPNRKEK